MNNYEKTLIGESIPLLEVDDEETNNDESIEKALIDADFNDLLDNIGNDEFKSIYLNLYDEILINADFEKKRLLCEKIIDKIFDIYDFEFIPSLNFYNNEDIDKFFKFIEFLEFDNLNFLSEIFKNMDLLKFKKDIDLFINNNWSTIIDRISVFIYDNEFISSFMRTNNKENIINFIKKNSEKNKMLIILKIMEGELGNG